MGHRVLISGGAGFIGARLAKRLVELGDDVWILDSLHPQVHGRGGIPASLPPEVRFLGGDVAHGADWSAALRAARPTVVVHLAAETGTGQSLREASRHASVNVGGTAGLLDAMSALDLRPERLLVASSRAVYGDGAWATVDGATFYPRGRSPQDLASGRWDIAAHDGRPARPLPHDADVTHPNPISIYGVTKLAQERMLACWAEAFSVPLTVLRLQNVYGAGQALENPYTGVLTLFARTALARREIDVFEDGAILRDFVHVSDVVAAIVAALERGLPGVRTLDIGSGSATTVLEVARLIATRAGAPAPRVSGRFRAGDVRAAAADISHARRDLGYNPTMTLSAGLSELLDSVKGIP